MRILSLALLLFAACGGTEGGNTGTPGAALYASDGGDARPSDGTLGSLCGKPEDCESGICNPYPAKGGNLCTNTCDASNVATQCPAPATGCNKMGVCKF